MKSQLELLEFSGIKLVADMSQGFAVTNRPQATFRLFQSQVEFMAHKSLVLVTLNIFLVMCVWCSSLGVCRIGFNQLPWGPSREPGNRGQW